MMYTKGYVNQEMTVSQRAYPGATRPKPHVWWPASEKLHSTRRRAPPQHTGMESWQRTTTSTGRSHCPGSPRIAKSHHDRRRDTQRPALAHRFLGWQSHNQDQLDEKERDRENPVDIPVGIIERRTSEANRVVARLRVELHIEGIIPGVENAEVVVCRDGGHQTGDGERCAVLLVHVVDLEPEEDRRTSHPRDTERERVVHRAPASVVPSIDEGRHDELSENNEQNPC